MGIKLSLAASILLDLGVFNKRPVNILMSFFFLFVVLYSQQSFVAWGIKVEKLSAHDLISLSVYMLVFVVLGFILRLLQDINKSQQKELVRLNQAVLKLTHANTGFQKYANLIERKSIVDERHRITSEIHDSIGHTMTNIIMMVEAAIHLSNSESSKLREILSKTRQQAQKGHNEIRSALRLLRNRQPAEEKGLKAIVRLINTFEEATGVRVETEYGNVPDSLNEDLEMVVYHLVQETMTNSLRHGKATQIKIYFWRNDSNIIINVVDNGRSDSVDGLQEGIGLSGIRENIEKWGGKVVFFNGTDGFTVNAELPYRKRMTKNV